jgi:hypothetical protein
MSHNRTVIVKNRKFGGRGPASSTLAGKQYRRNRECHAMAPRDVVRWFQRLGHRRDIVRMSCCIGASRGIFLDRHFVLGSLKRSSCSPRQNDRGSPRRFEVVQLFACTYILTHLSGSNRSYVKPNHRMRTATHRLADWVGWWRPISSASFPSFDQPLRVLGEGHRIGYPDAKVNLPSSPYLDAAFLGCPQGSMGLPHAAKTCVSRYTP